MSSYHFYEAKNEDTDEIFEILKNFEEEVKELNYPKVDNDKLKSRIFYFIEHGKIIMVKNLALLVMKKNLILDCKLITKKNM